MHDQSIAITGGTGFFGWHLRARLKAIAPTTEVRVIGRAEYDDEALLSSALAGVAAVVHLAGANRGRDEAVYASNIELANGLVRGLEAAGGSPQLIYANSVHAEGETAYGASKRESGALVRAWGHRAGAVVVDLRFPNLFGEGGRPRYNSAVATFCADLADGHASDVDPDGRMELLHVQDASKLVMQSLDAPVSRTLRVSGQKVRVPAVYDRLRRLRSEYHGAALPALRDRLDLQLFNALRTAMFPGHCPIHLDARRDSRGVFAELARGSGATQTSLGVTAPGQTRGEHFHLEKIERFVVVSGQGVIRLRRLFSNDVIAFPVSGARPAAVDMPPLYAHSLTNVGTDDLVTVFWSNDHFNAGAPDTYPEQVEPVPALASA